MIIVRIIHFFFQKIFSELLLYARHRAPGNTFRSLELASESEAFWSALPRFHFTGGEAEAEPGLPLGLPQHLSDVRSTDHLLRESADCDLGRKYPTSFHQLQKAAAMMRS